MRKKRRSLSMLMKRKIRLDAASQTTSETDVDIIALTLSKPRKTF